MKDQKEFVERLLELGLVRRGEAEPETGLETRILARLRVESSTPRAWTRSWQFGLSVAAVVALAVSTAFFVFYSAKQRGLAPQVRATPEHGNKAARTSAAEARSPSLPNFAGLEHAKNRGSVSQVRATVRRTKGADAAPRLSVFPSPAPLTEQEKLLISLVEHNNQKALDALAETLPPPGPPAPLVIKPIVINPLPPLAPVARTSGFEVRGSFSDSQKTD